MVPHLSLSSKVLIIGFGRFGQHMLQLLKDKLPKLHVRVYDQNEAAVPPELFVPLSKVTDYDVVILAVPIGAYEAVIKDIALRVRSDAILVDVASVKVHTSRLLKKYFEKGFRISTHPMWGPESYKKTKGDVKGYRLVVTECTLPPSQYKMLYALLTSAGIEIIKMNPEHHDGHLSKTLFLTHFIGQVVHFAGFDRTEIDTVSFGYLMDAVESVREDAALFLDVYRFNKTACAGVLARLEDSTHQVRQLIEGVNV